MHGIDGDLTFYSTVTKEIVKTFGQIAANEIEISFNIGLTMFQYISDILGKFTPGQRILALLLLLFTITLISVGPNIVSSLTHDTDELTAKVKRQKTEIQDLSVRVNELNKMVLDNQSECTNNLLAKEREVLDILTQIERDAARLHTKTIRTTSQVESRRTTSYVMDNDTGPQVSAMVLPSRDRVHTTTTQIDNSLVLSRIQQLRKKLHFLPMV